ncbi:LpqB family beta-propeller domain-containing protein [Actinacidiphila acidipaludis]|uniref:Lipoprotein LpqB n=1 Tax=Actinacidiphila acidipaludis TaxID=2873382 RepID=A0ABS7QJV8_9ACTN|nr:LpqB family beta-propeller domain-containing protein [Streptomyces acidipaludis]MBY8882705.1 hypothetical protein [Streptomyces acidipaludis]
MGALGGRRRLLHGVLPLGVTLLLAGCASMPSSGEVRKIGDGQRADADSQVRVFGIPPHPGESPQEIVSGFLEATTSGEANFSTAKKYLTKHASTGWDPFGKITIVSGLAQPVETVGTSHPDGYSTVTVTSTQVATVDTKHGYLPAQDPSSRDDFQASFGLVKQSGEWRIDGLPGGLALSQSDFQRIYHSVNMYYFADLGPDGRGSGGGSQTLVADPVYLRNQNDSLESTVSALLDGPTDWLRPVVTTAAPAGVRLDGAGPDHGVSLDDSQQLTVRLDHKADRLRGQRCVQLAAQLFATVQAQASAKLSSAEIQHANGTTACNLPSAQAEAYGPENLVGSTTRQYYIRSDSSHRLMELAGDSTTTTQLTAGAVAGPFGGDKAGLESVAVRRDEQVAAGVRNGGRQLVVASLTGGDSMPSAVLTSTATDAKNGLSAPSWDGLGDLWVADRSSRPSQLKVLVGGRGPAAPVSMPHQSGRIESLKVASDGVRIALIVTQKGVSSLEIGRVQRGGTPEHPTFSVTGLRVLPSDDNVVSVAWAGASRLVVLANQSGVQQIAYMSTDGSAGAALQGVSEAASVAASEDQSRPLLAAYNGSVYLLPADTNWKQIAPKGVSPVYPG